MVKEPNPLEKEGTMITSRDEFGAALMESRLEEAEKFLKKVGENRESYPDYEGDEGSEFLDHDQRSLFKKYHKAKDWKSAKRVVELSHKPSSKVARIDRLEELSGMNYEDI